MRRVIAALLISLVGCGTLADNSRRAVVVGVHSLAAVADVLGPIDQAKTDAAVAKARAGDVAGGQADLDKWSQQFGKISQALSIAWDALRALADGVNALEKNSKSNNLPLLTANLAKALADLSANLAEAGIKIPGM